MGEFADVPFTCPVHGQRLAQSPAALQCPEGHAFPIVEGIPRFVTSDGYAGAFGRQWNRFRRTQLDSYTRLPLSEERALRCLGLDASREHRDGLLRAQNVLEVGCGAGRFTEVLLKHGANVTSIDLSAAVEANARNFRVDERHRVAQADVRALPFPPRRFDGVFCLGVVQHTPQPEQTVAALYDQVRPGGWLAFDHYARSLSTVTWLGVHATRQVFKRLPPERQLPAVERLVRWLLPVHVTVAARGRASARVLSRLSPVLSYYHVHPELDQEQQREWAVLDTHDALTDVYKHHRSRGEIERLLKRLGLVDVVVRRAGNGIEAFGRRPVTPAQ